MDDYNPVFGFRAKFRMLAKRVQWQCMSGGAVLFLGGGAYALGVHAVVGGMIAGVGFFFLLLGICWGFLWRSVLRNEFKKKYGPPA